MACTVTPSKITVAFSKYVSQDYVELNTHFFIKNVLIKGDWISCTGNQYDVLWLYKHNEVIQDNLDVKVYFIDFISTFLIQKILFLDENKTKAQFTLA